MRKCEICNSIEAHHIHRQKFALPDLAEPVHYDVVACYRCGFTFASNIPSQTMLNNSYQAAENHIHKDIASGLAQIHQDFFEFITTKITIPTNAHILDVGSGMGHFLRQFQQAGFLHLTGIEPSSAAVKLGKLTYNLDIHNDNIDSFTSTSTYDLITLCGVLEHIAELQNAVHKLSTLLTVNGHLFVAVPNAPTFGNTPNPEPFLEFALEHINFFSKVSLDNLLRQAGFVEVVTDSRSNDFYGNRYLLGLYRKISPEEHEQVEVSIDTLTAASMHSYVKNSILQQICVTSITAQFVDTGEPLLIWGAGSLTSRLLCSTDLASANVIAIIDRNRTLQGKYILGIPIVGDEVLAQFPGTTVLIASTTYSHEIATLLIDKFQWSGKIVRIINGKIHGGTNEPTP